MKQIVFTALALLLIPKLFSQHKDSTAKLIFGFNIGLNYSGLLVRDQVPGVSTSGGGGFRLGLLADMRLSEKFCFSPKAELSFNDASVVETKRPDEKILYEAYPVSMEFSPHFTYKFNQGKTSPYVLFGPSCKFLLKENRPVRYAATRTCIAFDLGLGIDKKLRYFNLAPELRYSLGLNNTSNMGAVGRMYFHNVTLVFNFKG